jgi:Fe-S cluster biosynthesis and repair protein YggX
MKNLNIKLIKHYEEDCDILIERFLKYNNSSEIESLRCELNKYIQNRLDTKHSYINHLINSNDYTLDVKNEKIMELTSISSSENTMKRVYSLSPKVEEYANILSKTILKNSQSIKDSKDDKKINKSKEFFEMITNKQNPESADLSHFYKNLAFVVITIICKLFTSTSTDKSIIIQQNLIFSIAQYTIETYSILKLRLDKSSKGNTIFNSNKKMLDDYKNKVLKLKDKDLFDLGIFLLHCVNNTPISDQCENKLIEQIVVRENLKTKIYYKLSEDGANLLSVLPNYGNIYPLLKQTITFTPNQTLYSERLFIHSMYKYSDSSSIRDECTTINDDVFEALNYMQQTPYVINKKQLNMIENNLLEFYLLYTSFDYVVLKKTLKQYLEPEMGCKNNKAIRDLKKIEYGQKIVTLEKFCDIYCFAHIYKDYKMFYNHCTDFRGRIYTSAYPLNPQGDFLSRSLITIDGIEECIGHDVSASGFQIMGLLSGNLKLLELTNFVERKFYPKKDYKDLYDYLKKEFIKYYTDKQNLNINFKLDKTDLINIFDRALIKDMAMCYIYGEGNISRADKIGNKYTFLDPENKFLSQKERYHTAVLFETFIKENFDELNGMKELITSITSEVCKENNKFMTICASKKHITTILTYRRQKNYRFSFLKNGTGIIQKVNFAVPITPLKIDIPKTLRSVVANYIHMIDAAIATKIVLECKRKNIKIFTVHDSFYVDPKHTNDIMNIYYKCVLELFLDSKDYPLINLIEKNLPSMQQLSKRDELAHKGILFYDEVRTTLLSGKNNSILKIEKGNYYE